MCGDNMKNDLTGQVFGRLTVLKKVSKVGEKNSRWLCECNCPEHKQIIALRCNLIKGNTMSCGCLRREATSKRMKKSNEYNLSNSYGIGYTSNNNEFYFDLEDYDKIKNYCWHIDSDGYVVCTSNNKCFYMHRVVSNAVDNEDVDHKNHLTYDNRKENLRKCSTSQNLMNANIRSDNTSGHTGVYWNKNRNKWMSVIGVYNKDIFLGYYKNFEDAVRARKEAEEKYFGEFSYCNSMREANNELQ